MEKEEIKASFYNALAIVKKLIKKGNITKIVIKDKNDKVILNVPVNIVVAGGILSPFLAGSAFGFALFKSCKIEIEKESVK